MRRLPALVLAGCLALSACGAGQADAAVINGQGVSRSALDNELKDMAHNKGFVTALEQLQGGPGKVQATVPGTFNQPFVAFTLTRRIEYLLIHQELVRRHALPSAAAVTAAKPETVQDYTVTQGASSTPAPLLGAFPARYQDILVQRRADLDALRGTLVQRNVSDQAVRQYYDTHQDQFLTEICVRHILVADQVSATRIKAQLDAGGDFAALAKADSTDTGSAVNGGALKGSATDGCLASQDVQQLVSQFTVAMLALPVGQVSQPVQSQFGYHLIEVTSRKVQPFDAQASQAARQQLEQPSQQTVANLLNTLVQSATVTVDPAFGHFDKKGASGPAVIPPTGPQLSPSSGHVPGAASTTTPATTSPASTGQSQSG